MSHNYAILTLAKIVNDAEWFSIAAFNDDPITTHEDVMKVFDEAIDSLS